MKKELLVFVLTLLFQFSFGQNLAFVNAEPAITGNDTDLAYIKLHVKNVGTVSQNVYAKRKIQTLIKGQQSYFCFGATCYPPAVNKSTDILTLAPGDEDSTLKTYCNPRGTAGTSIINYCVITTNNSDSVCITLTYNQLATGIIYNSNKLFVNAFPNPATNEVTLLYNTEKIYLSKELVIADLAGKIIEKITVDATEGIANIATHNYPNGVYVCRLMADGAPIAYTKLVIQK
jgi:hypothetical protein